MKMFNKSSKKQGISLIVLVITIIVMIILAATVIISLSNSGIISKANEAVGKTNLNNLQDAATILWADAYSSGKRGAELVTAVKEGLKQTDSDYESKYAVEVTDSSVKVVYRTVPYELEKYILGKEGQGRSIMDPTFVSYDSNGNAIFQGDDIIPDAATSVICLKANNTVEPYYAIVSYKGNTYKGYIDGVSYKTTSLEVCKTVVKYAVNDSLGFLDFGNKVYLYTITNDGLILLGGSERQGDTVNFGDLGVVTIKDNVLTLSQGTNINGILTDIEYCEHEWKDESDVDNCHSCKKCGINHYHSTYDPLLGRDHEGRPPCVCGHASEIHQHDYSCDDEGYCVCIICGEGYSEEPEEHEHSGECDDTGNCVCGVCGAGYYDESYDMSDQEPEEHEHSGDCNENGDCICDICGETYYDENYDSIGEEPEE